ncbi:MAG: hypothetical protein HZA10_03070 [Nitrospirae bacterium]|nr:hypothetical protein [Nitrospirota bacterium]
MKKYDKSLIEVWEWKEKVYHDVKDLDAKEYVRKIKNDADKILAKNQIRLKAVSQKEKYQKVA